MIREFIEFTSEIISGINPYTVENIKSAIMQFKVEGKKLVTTLENNFDYLTQGDILDNIPFYKVNGKTGKLEVFKTRGIILSNTCDCDRDENIIMAPFIPIKDTQKDRQALMNNISYGHLYLPDNKLDNYVVDFSLSCTFNRELILKGLEKKAINKIASLNSYGYYLFLCKMTIYLMRPEDAGVKEERIKEVAS